MSPELDNRSCAGLLTLLAVPILVAGIACAGTKPTVASANAGHLVLNVRGNVSAIVLVDPLGRTDQEADSLANNNIPKCSRWPGGLERGEGESSVDLMTFEVGAVQYGRYFLYARADSLLDVTVSATFEPAIPDTHACADLSRMDRVATGRHGWAIDVRRAPPRGECTIRISSIDRQKRTPRRH